MSKIKNTSSLVKDYPAWTEISLKAIEHNFKEIRRLASSNEFLIPTRATKKEKFIDPIQILAVIKADAYGHGMKEVGLLLDKLGCGYLAVSDITEGIVLRRAGIRKPILIFESTLLSQVQLIIDYRLMPTICTLEMAKSLNRLAQRSKRKVNIHVEVDTGMGRLGVWHKDTFGFIKEIYTLKNLKIHGIFTHFPSADTNHSRRIA